MKQEAVVLAQTADGSNTLFHPKVGEHYHSKHGALQESKHVFLGQGLRHFLADSPHEEVSVLEVGFGTGLNFLLTTEYCRQEQLNLYYEGIEAFPLSLDTISSLRYDEHVLAQLWEDFVSAYDSCVDTVGNVGAEQLKIAHVDVLNYRSDRLFDVIYFDAFAAVHQPEMWSKETLSHVCSFLKLGGVFVTYAITGELKRTMKALGFDIEKAPGAPGKREMLRAVKQY